MKRTALALAIVLLLAAPGYPAEFLVRAKGHWKDEWTQQQVNALSTQDRKTYEARSQREDIVVVRPDGWQWGSKECLPDFVVIKVPGMTMAAASQYEGPLILDGRLKKAKKWHVRKQDIDDAIANNQSVITMTESDFNGKKLEKLSKTVTVTTQ